MSLPLLLLLAGCGPDPADVDPFATSDDAQDPAAPGDDGDAPDDWITPMMPGTTGVQPVNFPALTGSWGDRCYLSASNHTLIDTNGITPSALNSAARVVTAKVRRTVGTPFYPTTGAVCSEILNQLRVSLRQGDCPDFTGTAVEMGGTALTRAMNGTEDKFETTYGAAIPGVWCNVDLATGSPAATDADNIYWAVIYGMANWTAASVVFADPTASTQSSHAVYGLSYNVPLAVYPTYANFLGATTGAQIVGLYPAGATFALQGVSMTLVNGTASTAPTGSSGFFTLDPTGTAVIDPDDTYEIETEQELVDAFVAQNVEVATLESTCAYASSDWDGTIPSRRIRGQLGTPTSSTTCP